MMGIQEAIAVSYEALLVIIKIVTPLLLVSTAIGLGMTIFQSVTNINESTLQQDLKIFAVLWMTFALGPVIYEAVRAFAVLMFDRIASLGMPS